MITSRIGFEPRLTKKSDKEATLPNNKPLNKLSKLPKESAYDKVVRLVEGDTHNEHPKSEETEERARDRKVRFRPT
jgi:hypothetical protein